MRLLTNLFFKVTVSSMVLTAPAMIDGHAGGALPDKETDSPFASAVVIKNYINHLKIWPVRAYVDQKSAMASFPYISGKSSNSTVLPLHSPEFSPVMPAEKSEKKELIASLFVSKAVNT